MPKKHYKLTKKKVVREIVNHRGILKYVAEACGVNRTSLYDFLEYYPDLWDVVKGARAELTDSVEHEMLSIIFSKDPRMVNQKANLIKFYMSNQAKDRGYNKEEKEEKSSQPIVIEMHGIPRPNDDNA